MECSGFEDSIRFSIFSTKSGGVVVFYSMGKPEVTLNIFNFAVQEEAFSDTLIIIQKAIQMVGVEKSMSNR